MSTEPVPKANPMDAFESVFQSVWYRLVLLLFALALTVLWFGLGPSNPLYAVMVAWGTCSLEPAVAAPLFRLVPRQRFRVPAGERVLHRIAGLGMFGWLLELIGWNHLIRRIRGFSGKRGLLALEQSARSGGIAHGICFAIHVLLAVLALFSRRPLSGALWMLLPGVVVHLYPVLLQRSIILRLQPLLDKTDARLQVSN